MFPHKVIVKSLIDVALWIVKDHPELVNNSDVLGVLAQKPDAFSKRKSNIIMNTVKWGKHLYSFVGM